MKPYICFLNQGGKWLGNIRAWIQREFRNGETVIWGSNDKLEPYVTVFQIEEAAARGYAEAYNDRKREVQILKEKIKEFERQTAKSETTYASAIITEGPVHIPEELYDLVTIRGRNMNDMHIINKGLKKYEILEKRAVSGDIVVFTGTKEIVPDPWWLFDWEKDENEKSFARSMIKEYLEKQRIKNG